MSQNAILDTIVYAQAPAPSFGLVEWSALALSDYIGQGPMIVYLEHLRRIKQQRFIREFLQRFADIWTKWKCQNR